MVQYLGEESWLCVNAAVGNGGVGRGQLQVGNTLCDAAQGSGCSQVVLCKGGNAHVFCVLHTQLRRDCLHKTAHSHNVHGVDDAVPDAGVTGKAIAGIPPVPEGLVSYGVGRVVVDRAQGGAAGIQGGREGRDDLKGGAWLAVYVAGAVQGKTGCLFAAAAAQRLDLACVLI